MIRSVAVFHWRVYSTRYKHAAGLAGDSDLAVHERRLQR